MSVTSRHEYYRQLFHGRCIHCGRIGTDVHEIETRGHIGEQALMDEENGVLLCRECHQWAHLIGSERSGKLLSRERRRALDRYAIRENRIRKGHRSP